MATESTQIGAILRAEQGGRAQGTGSLAGPVLKNDPNWFAAVPEAMALETLGVAVGRH